MIFATCNLIISLAILPGLLALAFIVHTVLWNYVHCEHLFHHPWSTAHSIMIHHPVFPTNDDKKLPPPSSDDSFGFPLPQGRSNLYFILHSFIYLQIWAPVAPAAPNMHGFWFWLVNHDPSPNVSNK